MTYGGIVSLADRVACTSRLYLGDPRVGASGQPRPVPFTAICHELSRRMASYAGGKITRRRSRVIPRRRRPDPVPHCHQSVHPGDRHARYVR